MKSEFTAPINASRRENLVQPNLLIQILFRSPSITKTSYPNFRLARWKSMGKVWVRLGTGRSHSTTWRQPTHPVVETPAGRGWLTSSLSPASKASPSIACSRSSPQRTSRTSTFSGAASRRSRASSRQDHAEASETHSPPRRPPAASAEVAASRRHRHRPRAPPLSAAAAHRPRPSRAPRPPTAGAPAAPPTASCRQARRSSPPRSRTPHPDPAPTRTRRGDRRAPNAIERDGEKKTKQNKPNERRSRLVSSPNGPSRLAVALVSLYAPSHRPAANALRVGALGDTKGEDRSTTAAAENDRGRANRERHVHSARRDYARASIEYHLL